MLSNFILSLFLGYCECSRNKIDRYVCDVRSVMPGLIVRGFRVVCVGDYEGKEKRLVRAS